MPIETIKIASLKRKLSPITIKANPYIESNTNQPKATIIAKQTPVGLSKTTTIVTPTAKATAATLKRTKTISTIEDKIPKATVVKTLTETLENLTPRNCKTTITSTTTTTEVKQSLPPTPSALEPSPSPLSLSPKREIVIGNNVRVTTVTNIDTTLETLIKSEYLELSTDETSTAENQTAVAISSENKTNNSCSDNCNDSNSHNLNTVVLKAETANHSLEEPLGKISTTNVKNPVTNKTSIAITSSSATSSETTSCKTTVSLNINTTASTSSLLSSLAAAANTNNSYSSSTTATTTSSSGAAAAVSSTQEQQQQQQPIFYTCTAASSSLLAQPPPTKIFKTDHLCVNAYGLPPVAAATAAATVGHPCVYCVIPVVVSFFSSYYPS